MNQVKKYDITLEPGPNSPEYNVISLNSKDFSISTFVWVEKPKEPLGKLIATRVHALSTFPATTWLLLWYRHS